MKWEMKKNTLVIQEGTIANFRIGIPEKSFLRRERK